MSPADVRFIPVVAVALGMAIAMLSVWTEHKRKSQLLDQYHKERLVALDKGVELPELDRRLVALDEADTPARAFRNGIMMLLLGVILFFAIDRLLKERFALFGLIPTAVGIANLVYGVLLTRKDRSDASRRQAE